MMKDIILAVIIAVFLLISLKLILDFLSRRQRVNAFIQISLEHPEDACKLMEKATDCRIRLEKAHATREKKSSCPRPTKLRQLLFSLLNPVITAGVSAAIKSLIEGYLG